MPDASIASDEADLIDKRDEAEPISHDASCAWRRSGSSIVFHRRRYAMRMTFVTI